MFIPLLGLVVNQIRRVSVKSGKLLFTLVSNNDASEQMAYSGVACEW